MGDGEGGGFGDFDDGGRKPRRVGTGHQAAAKLQDLGMALNLGLRSNREETEQIELGNKEAMDVDGSAESRMQVQALYTPLSNDVPWGTSDLEKPASQKADTSEDPGKSDFFNSFDGDSFHASSLLELNLS